MCVYRIMSVGMASAAISVHRPSVGMVSAAMSVHSLVTITPKSSTRGHTTHHLQLKRTL